MVNTMDRLTFEGNFCDISQCREVLGSIFCKDGDCDQRKTWEKLKHFEDLQEQGRLLVLPCKLSRTIYIIDDGKIQRCIVSEIISNGGVLAICTDADISYGVYKANIGKTVFLTRAEAQAALDRLESK